MNLRSQGVNDDRMIEQRLSQANAELRSLGLVRHEQDPTGFREPKISIWKSWFQLALDELRRQGRRV